MKDAYILCNAIQILLMKENNKDIKMKALYPFEASNGIDTIL
jgi:hypothetical protein